MKISERLICSWFTVAAVWGAAMIVCIRMLLHYGRQNPFVDVACWEIGLAIVACFVGIVKAKIELLRKLVICKVTVEKGDIG